MPKNNEFNEKDFIKEPIEYKPYINSRGEKVTPPKYMVKFAALFDSYHLKNPPTITTEQAHDMLRLDKPKYDALPLVKKVEINQVLANHEADRIGVKHPTVRVVNMPKWFQFIALGKANGDSIYLDRYGVIENRKISANIPVHETRHHKHIAIRSGDATPDEQYTKVNEKHRNNKSYVLRTEEVDARLEAINYTKEFNLPGTKEFETIEDGITAFHAKKASQLSNTQGSKNKISSVLTNMRKQKSNKQPFTAQNLAKNVGNKLDYAAKMYQTYQSLFRG
ncbi:MAG: hypothetical protein LBM38_05875 [Clostridiales bacterium]|jgi:hypothetical protein|nr:hypothetical protein [Clostridiales bacterium]